MRRVLSILILGILLLSQAGCNTKPTLSQGYEDKLIKKTHRVKYLITNGIQIAQPQMYIKTVKGITSVFLPVISGLSDKSLEAKINTSIKVNLENEVKAYVAEVNENQEYLSCEVGFNSNNLLSIYIHNYTTSPICGLLYNLTNGNRLYLSNIFTKGTDYVPLINEKVTLGILGGNVAEEDLLRSPFTTIKIEQDFALTGSTLYIIFHADESGFAERSSIAIPLSKIDNYVDIIDRSAGSQTTYNDENYKFPNLIIKNNNIFTDSRGEVFKRNNGKVMVFHPVISGFQNVAYEKTINNTIMKKIKEVVYSKELNHKIIADSPRDQIGEVDLEVVFNAYDILSISLYAIDFTNGNHLQHFNTIFSFDLAGLKPIEIKAIINAYKAKHIAFEKTFTDQVKKSIIKQNALSDKASIATINNSIDYAYIMKNALFSFCINDLSSNIQISIEFNAASLFGLPIGHYCSFPLKEIIKESPEIFLKSN